MSSDTILGTFLLISIIAFGVVSLIKDIIMFKIKSEELTLPNFVKKADELCRPNKNEKVLENRIETIRQEQFAKDQFLEDLEYRIIKLEDKLSDR